MRLVAQLTCIQDRILEGAHRLDQETIASILNQDSSVPSREGVNTRLWVLYRLYEGKQLLCDSDSVGFDVRHGARGKILICSHLKARI